MSKKAVNRQALDAFPVLMDHVSFSQNAGKKGLRGLLFILGTPDLKFIARLIDDQSFSWQAPSLRRQKDFAPLHFSGKAGPVWIVCRSTESSTDSDYAWYRDHVGPIILSAQESKVDSLEITLVKTFPEQELGALVGLELAAYTYKAALKAPTKKSSHVQIFLKTREGTASSLRETWKSSRQLGLAINIARHLVNMPPNRLGPEDMAVLVKSLLQKKSNLTVSIWDENRLRQEKMGLHLAVGQGGSQAPRLVHICYRPKKNRSAKAIALPVILPVAFVGKGITFDTGGLYIKDPQYMRLMKRDMGGAAALAGLAVWLAEAQPQTPVDIYLALAENSLDGKSFRPGDVVRARSGMSVEIDDTDAEGRLVLADALDVAITAKPPHEPELVIDIGTLTGDIKAALGAEVAGFFSNHDETSAELLKSGQERGEFSWRMPLYWTSSKDMETPFADTLNFVDGYGGSVTAALFLEKFIGTKSWAHFDVHAWSQKSRGALTSVGGSGQCVQTFVRFLETRASSTTEIKFGKK